MANLGVTGGIGAGIMQGLQFMRQREGDARQEQALANQTELLGMQKQLHGEKMGELNRANEERMKAETRDTLKTSIDYHTHTVNGDARFRDVGSQHHLPLSGRGRINRGALCAQVELTVQRAEQDVLALLQIVLKALMDTSDLGLAR